MLGSARKNSPYHNLEMALVLQSESGVIRRVPKLGIELEDVVASVRVFSQPLAKEDAFVRTHFDTVRAKYFGKPVVAFGTLERQAITGDDSLDLVAFGVDLPFQGVLLRKVVSSVSAKAAEALAPYSFGGAFDATLAVRKTQLVDVTSIEGELRDAALSGPGVPGNLAHFRGRLAVDSGGSVRGDLLRGTLNGTELNICRLQDYAGRHAPPLQISGRVSSDDPVDVMDAFGRARPDMRAWIDEYGVAILASAKSFRWTLTVPDDAPASLAGSGEIELRGGSVLKSKLIRNMRGPVEIQQMTYDESGFSLRATARQASCDMLYFPVTNFSGAIDFTRSDILIGDATASIVGASSARA